MNLNSDSNSKSTSSMMKRRKETTEQILCAGCCIIVGFLVPIFALITGAIEAIFFTYGIAVPLDLSKVEKDICNIMCVCCFTGSTVPLHSHHQGGHEVHTDGQKVEQDGFSPTICHRFVLLCRHYWRGSLNAKELMNSLAMLQYVTRVLQLYFLCKELTESPSENIKAIDVNLVLILSARIISSEIPHLNDLCPINSPNMHRSLILVYVVDVLQSGISESTNYPQKFSNCFWWGLRNLSSLGSNLQRSNIHAVRAARVAARKIKFENKLDKKETEIARMSSSLEVPRIG
ncbi:cyclic nucleotide gated channel 1 [Prunus dulcis]|uniref:Cyclic nucleotide gated channel 1 n=1 Tax=Prunus dulcis TaxID=3755 RepID=A0A4Y1R1C9_PRUDU|nr:cyclic nucleotide gated channel 1 [Prunus dulcis]